MGARSGGPVCCAPRFRVTNTDRFYYSFQLKLCKTLISWVWLAPGREGPAKIRSAGRTVDICSFELTLP